MEEMLVASRIAWVAKMKTTNVAVKFDRFFTVCLEGVQQRDMEAKWNM